MRTPLRHRPGPRRATGFTIIELAVVIGMVAIVAAVAIPSFRSFIDSMDAKNASMDLVADLTAARGEALKRNTAITVSPINGDWSSGWRVLAGGNVLGERTAIRPGISLAATRAALTFLPNGRLSDADASASNFAWNISSLANGVQPRCVVITPTGSARSKKGTCT